MTPRELTRRLQAYQARAAASGDQVETTLCSLAATLTDGDVSAVITRTPTGVRLGLAGPGARSQAPALAARLRTEATAALWAWLR